MESLSHQENYLFKQISVGKEKAFREIFHTYNAKLFPFILKLTHSETVAEDLVQEVFLRLWTNRYEVGRMEYPASWLYTVASNLSLSWLRAHAAELRRFQKLSVNKGAPQEQIIEHISAKEIQSLIWRAVALLPPKRQQIYKLSRERGLNHKEIAEQLELSPNTIKNQLISALKFIRNYLLHEGGIAVSVLGLLFF